LDLLADLTDAQRQAVTHVDGPLLVLAGAGSGKTRVITRRVAYLVHQGIAPWHVLAVTFTNKAATEMRQRVEALGTPRGTTIGTFHWLCVRLLREFADLAGVPANFTIYDRDDQLRCLKQAMEQLSLRSANFMPAAVHSAISRAKNSLLDAAAYAEAASGFFERTVAKAYRAYQRILADNRALDFDDLLMRTAFLMRDRPDVRLALSERYRYVLIDEYQDTNHAQYVIAHGIALEHENICATGDPDQSIYAWRGADISNILDFETDYPNAVVVRLERNYRSYQPILTAASTLIARNRRRKHKRLLADRSGGGKVQVIRLGDEHAEAAEVAALAEGLHAEGVPYGGMAVFYRVNALSRLLEEAFRRAAIPYQIARGVEYYNRAEIKDVLAYLRLLVNGGDDLSCRRIINVPARGIGAVTVNRLAAAAEARGISLLEACSAPESAGLGKAAARKVAAFAKLMSDLGGLARSADVREAVEAVLDRSGLEQAFRGDEEQRQALRNVQELVSSAADFDRDNPGADLADYLYQVSLVSDIDSIDPESGAVTLMTLHAAKGLEFTVVFIIGCEEGLLPFHRKDDDGPREVEEERRLAFVGMTRARDRLYMTSAKYRMLRGVRQRQIESPFLAEIGTDAVERADKTPLEPRPRRPRVGVEQFNRPAEGFYEDADQRALIEAMETADLIPAQFAGIRPGRRVWHAKFGTGQVLTVSADGTRTRAVVRFDRVGQKTLILEYARLELM